MFQKKALSLINRRTSEKIAYSMQIGDYLQPLKINQKSLPKTQNIS